MSSSSSSSIPKLISFIFILFLASNLNVVTSAKSKSKSSKSLIRKSCSNFARPESSKLCNKLLWSNPKIASSTNFLNLSVAIMHSGISNATKTLDHIVKLFRGRRGPTDDSGANSKGALQECRHSFGLAILSFRSALSEVKHGVYGLPTYDLMIGSTDDIRACENNLASGRIKDDLISYGVKVVPIYGLSASEALDNM